MTKYIWGGDDWVDVATLEKAPRVGPFIISDTPTYISPVTGKPVDGRAARREDLKRSGSREVDPSEFKPVYRNAEFAKKRGLEVGGDPLAKPVRLPTTIGA
jgi:hypothetical protein